MIRPFAALTLVAGICLTIEAEVPDKTFDVSPGQTLHVDLKTGGSIRIRGTAEKTVTVNTTIKGRNAEDFRVNFDQTKTGVSITSRYAGSTKSHSGRVDLVITVPNQFLTDLHTTGGSIAIDGVEGSHKAKTMGGSLDLRNLKGKVSMTTMGGSIDLVSSQVDGKVSTMGGKVKIKDVSGDIKGTSMGGDVIYENVQRPGMVAGNKRVEISTMGGDIKVGNAPAGAKVKTMGGAIRIGSAKDFVDATTMGGSIEIEALDGGVNAITYGGDITVTMVGDPSAGRRDVTLKSLNGELRLTVPASLSADIEVELAYTKNSARDFKITSDFPLTITETPEWDDDHGTPRKTIHAKGSTGGGKNKIHLKTINGNVVIKKQ